MRRWSRKHRTLVSTAAAVLVLGLLSSAGFAAVVTAKNRDLARQTQRAQGREQMAIDAVKHFRDVVVEDAVLKNNPALEALRKKLLKEPLAFFKSFREQLQLDNETRPEALKRLAEAAHDHAHLTWEIGDIQDGLRSHVESLAIWEKLVRDHPAKTEYQASLATIEHCRASMLSATGQPDQALESYANALAIRKRLARDNPSVTEFQSNLASSHNSIGELHSNMDHAEEALESYVKALAIRERLARDNPIVTRFQSDLARSHNSIGALQIETGHPDQALESYRNALAIRERLAREHPDVTAFLSDLAVSHNNIGSLQRHTGQPDQALASYAKALAICEPLACDNPSVTAFQHDSAISHINIANLHSATGRPNQALESYAKALAINERLARDHPEKPDYASELGATLNNMATIDGAARRFQEAHDQLRQAISWQKKALAANPNQPTYRQFLRNHLTNLINAAKALGKLDEGRTAQRELDELEAADPAKVALDARLNAVTRGEPPKDNRERLQLAYRAYKKTLNAASARLYAEALAADPKLADDRQQQHRYNGACAAVLAATAAKANGEEGVGTGAPKKRSPTAEKVARGAAEQPLTSSDRAKMRNQARTWLEAELNAWSKLLESAKARQPKVIAETLKHWQQDSDLAGVRDDAALTRLSEDERNEWKSLWADVDSLLKKARSR
jgi:tetratricopeptide (TPR) repeat protein